MTSDAWKKITLDDLAALPITHEATIPASYLDEMGHMNVMWYTSLYSHATTGAFRLVGLTREYFERTGSGTFALEQHLRYINEVRVKQRVSLRTRLVARSDKRFHFQSFMVNEDRRLLASICEGVGTHVDLKARRSSPFPPEIAEAFDRVLAEHSKLPWPAPLSGVMRV